MALGEKWCFQPWSTTTISVSIQYKFGKSHLNLALLHCIPHQRFMQEIHMTADSKLIYLRNTGSNLLVTKNHAIKGFVLIQSDQCCISVIFYFLSDLAHQVQIVLG